jgi:serine/threonine protein kinase
MAGVLHRDISAGNVLISEDGPGFLLDFDYSEFTEDGLARFKSLHPDFDLEEIDKDMKDITVSGSVPPSMSRTTTQAPRQGTYPFMSIPSLVHMGGMQQGKVHKHSSKHDLESFYWLLVWLLLRHVEHDDPEGPNACSSLFDGEARQVFRQKSSWLANMGFGGPRLPIRNNPPLTALVDALNTMFRTQNTDQNTPATHESLLAAFDKAIGSAGWPENDTAKEFVLPFVSLGMPPPYMPDAMSNAGSQVGSGSTSFWRQRAKAAVVVPRSEQEVEGPGSAGASGSSGVKRKRNEEGSGQGKRRSTRTKTIKH